MEAIHSGLSKESQRRSTLTLEDTLNTLTLRGVDSKSGKGLNVQPFSHQIHSTPTAELSYCHAKRHHGKNCMFFRCPTYFRLYSIPSILEFRLNE